MNKLKSEDIKRLLFVYLGEMFCVKVSDPIKLFGFFFVLVRHIADSPWLVSEKWAVFCHGVGMESLRAA